MMNVALNINRFMSNFVCFKSFKFYQNITKVDTKFKNAVCEEPHVSNFIVVWQIF